MGNKHFDLGVFFDFFQFWGSLIQLTGQGLYSNKATSRHPERPSSLILNPVTQ